MPKSKLNKKAFELSINFLVVMIISLAVFGLGIAFINKIYRGAEKTQEQYFERYEKDVQDLLCDVKDKVCIPRDTQDLGKNKHPYYGVVITNVLGSTDPNLKFKLYVEFNKFFDKASQPQTADTTGWIKYDQGDIKIPNNDAVKKAIALAVKGAKSGTYVFNVEVCTNHPVDNKNTFSTNTKCGGVTPNRYSNLQKIYLYVP